YTGILTDSYFWSVAGKSILFCLVNAFVTVSIGVAVALLGMLPRALPAAWTVVGLVAFVGFLGSGLRMPGWVLDLSPTTHIGDPPVGPVALGGVIGLVAVAAVLLVAGTVGFRRRTIPTG
ncbi:MAG: hypothetical protein IE926_19245, partial [Micrococcales bacterium]|nr:hypothetical protein [Micrococcales bacterium]